MKLMNKNIIRQIVTLFLLFLIAAFSVSAEGQAEMEKESDLVIGVIYASLSPGYFYQNVNYQPFDQAFQAELSALAEEKGISLIEIEATSSYQDGILAVEDLIDRGVDGLILSRRYPSNALQTVTDAHAADIPIVLLGGEVSSAIDAPFIGLDSYVTGIKLGLNAGRIFKERFPDEKPSVFTASSQLFNVEIELEQGFVDGFRHIHPSAEVPARIGDNGTVNGTMEKVRNALISDPELNVFFGSTDFRAQGIMTALRNAGRGSIESELVVGFGGSRMAIEHLKDPNGPWKIEGIVPVDKYAEKAISIFQKHHEVEEPLNEMIPEVTLVDAYILTEPSPEEMGEYFSDYPIAAAHTIE